MTMMMFLMLRVRMRDRVFFGNGRHEGDMEDRVIFDNMDDLGRPQGSYPESFVSLSLFLAEI